MKKDYKFQYYNNKEEDSLVECTELATLTEAIDLFNKYYNEAYNSIINGYEVEMVIWCDCIKNPGYGTEYMVMDSRDVKVRGGELYKVKPLGKKDFFIGGLEYTKENLDENL